MSMRADRWFWLAVATIVLAVWLCRYDVVMSNKGGAIVLNRITGQYHIVHRDGWYLVKRDKLGDK